MLFNLFTSAKAPIDEETILWIFDSFEWCLHNFDSEFFFQNSRLIKPDNQFFPGRVDSVEVMAQLIFKQVTEYAGMAHWPFEIHNIGDFEPSTSVAVLMPPPFRGDDLEKVSSIDPIPVYYDPQLINNPEALIASYAHTLAHYLGQTTDQPPPGGSENWPYITELLALFMGFGLMFANSAFSVAVKSCGSCGGNRAKRESYLSQYDMTYALALFCELKAIDSKEVKTSLKSALFPFYKRCRKELLQRGSLQRLTLLNRN